MPEKKSVESFQKLANNKMLFPLLLLAKLPAAFWAGVRLKELNDKHSIATIKFKYLNQNPFRSIYFACLAMAAELSTGALAMMYVHKRKPSVSMLVTDLRASFHKKAVGKIEFHCMEGVAFKEIIKKAIDTNEGQTLEVKSTGTNAAGEIVAEFWFEWSFKAKS